MTVLCDASDAMNVVFMKMLHSMRKEYDYSGLGLLYEACGTDLPFRIYQTLGDMIFNDRYLEYKLEEHEKDSPLFRGFYDRFDDYFGDLLIRANSAWESYLQPADVDDDEDDEGEELTFERFRRMIAASEDEDDAADDLMPSVVQQRIMKCCAYLMALSEAAGNDISNRFLEGIEENDPTNMVKNENHNKLSEDSLSGSFGNLTDFSAFSMDKIKKDQIQEMVQNLRKLMRDPSVDSIVHSLEYMRRWFNENIQLDGVDNSDAFYYGVYLGASCIHDIYTSSDRRQSKEAGEE